MADPPSKEPYELSVISIVLRLVLMGNRPKGLIRKAEEEIYSIKDEHYK
jgi:hypothetical protein